MSYDHTKYKALRSLEVPRQIALALSDDTNPLNNLDKTSNKAAAVADIPTPGSATAATIATKVNELLASLRAAGLLT